MADAADLLDNEVEGFGRSVAGGVERVDLLSPGIDGASKPGQLRDLRVGGVLEEYDQHTSSVGEVGGGVDLDEEFTGEPDGGDFAVGNTSSEPGAQAFPPLLGQVVPGAQQESADAVKRRFGFQRELTSRSDQFGLPA